MTVTATGDASSKNATSTQGAKDDGNEDDEDHDLSRITVNAFSKNDREQTQIVQKMENVLVIQNRCLTTMTSRQHFFFLAFFWYSFAFCNSTTPFMHSVRAASPNTTARKKSVPLPYMRWPAERYTQCCSTARPEFPRAQPYQKTTGTAR